MKSDNNFYRTDFVAHFGDSSNEAHDGSNGHEGVPERQQRLAKENKAKKEIEQKLLEGRL